MWFSILIKNENGNLIGKFSHKGDRICYRQILKLVIKKSDALKQTNTDCCVL